jgi:cation diffusion facilitator CzcD-associated flavoprotein CzcO
MLTLGYRFRPWPGDRTLAAGGDILDYVRATARERGVDAKVRYGHRVVAADWSGADARWTVTVETDAGTTQLTCGFLYSCTGYYRYDAGYTPDLPGVADFRGEIVHPQHWPAELDHTGKRVVVIGSGATAVTLVPAMAPDAAHVTMLQRSPSYVMSLPGRDAVYAALRRRLPDRAAAAVGRAKNVLMQVVSYQFARRAPKVMARLITGEVRKQLPAGYPVDKDFTPAYKPWDQRLCFVPEGDLFAAISSGKASVVTDRIAGFTPDGVRLASGSELPADVVVTATGLALLAIGGMRLTVDGGEVELADTVAYKGVMLTGVPNFALALGYTNASWTLKVDLASTYVCRLLRHLDRTGCRVVTPLPPPSGPFRPIIDLTAGYVLRGVDRLPRQGPSAPWRLYQNYPRDVLSLRHGPLTDAVEFR